MSAEILREYLIKLGFKSDENSLKKFTGGVTNAAKAAGKLALAIESAAAAVVIGVTAMAGHLEDLYFQSKRTGASATNLRAFVTAAKNIAGAGDEAHQSIEGLARFMRDQPGAEGFLKTVGVDARDANGQLRDTTDILVGLGKKFADMDFYVAKRYAETLGISENALRAMTSGQFPAEMEKQRELLKNAGFDKAARDAHDFDVKLRELTANISVASTTMGNSLINALGPQMNAATEWFSRNADKIAQILATIGNAFIAVGNIAMPILGKIYDGWKFIFDMVDRLTDKILNIMPESWVKGIARGTNKILNMLGIADQVDALMSGKPNPNANRNGPYIEDQGNIAPGLPVSTGERRNRALDFFKKSGFSDAQAAGLVANLLSESDLNPYATGDSGKAYGIAQWHPDRQEEFRKVFGKDIRQSSLDEQLQFVLHELTRGNEQKAGRLLLSTGNAQNAGEVISRYYERPLLSDQEAAKRSALALEMAANNSAMTGNALYGRSPISNGGQPKEVRISQDVTINVHGSNDPNATARAISRQQKDVGADLARNMKLVYQ